MDWGDEILGELRSLLHQPGARSWGELCAWCTTFFEGDDEEVFAQKLSPYVLGQLERWPEALRVMPSSWMAAYRDEPMGRAWFAMVRVIERPADVFEPELLLRLLQEPQIGQLHALRWPHQERGAKLTHAQLEVLFQLPSLRRLRGLDLSGHGESLRALEPMLGWEGLGSLEGLSLNGCPINEEVLGALLGDPVFAPSRLRLGFLSACRWTEQLFCGLFRPGLRALRVEGTWLRVSLRGQVETMQDLEALGLDVPLFEENVEILSGLGLRELELHENRWGEWRALTEPFEAQLGLHDFSTLERLVLHATYEAEQTAAGEVSSIELPRLRELRLERGTPGRWSLLLESLHAPQLTRVELKDVNSWDMEPGEAARFYRAVAAKRGLRELSLQLLTEWDEDCVEPWCELFERLTALDLRLGRRDFPLQFGMALKRAPISSLERLCLRSNGGFEGILSFLSEAMSLRDLRSLELDGWHRGDSLTFAWRRFAQSAPFSKLERFVVHPSLLNRDSRGVLRRARCLPMPLRGQFAG